MQIFVQKIGFLLVAAMAVANISNASLAACGEWHGLQAEQVAAHDHAEMPCDNCPEHEVSERDCCTEADAKGCHMTVCVCDGPAEVRAIPVHEMTQPASLAMIAGLGTSPPDEPPRTRSYSM